MTNPDLVMECNVLRFMNDKTANDTLPENLLLKKPVFLLLAWTLVIFILCATPGRFIPSANWLELLSFDKFVHSSMFLCCAA